MYKEYFGLEELPFSIAPDPRYLYMSEQHREALAHLVYGLNSDGGFVLLTGEVGTGKTTVCRCLLDQLPEDADVAFILNPKLTVDELLATVCDELGIHYPEGSSSVKVFVDRINSHLLDAHARGRKTVLIIEEAQNLSADVLEQLRLLTNLETNQRKLLQIIMLGQPELRDMLSRPELRQLAQRITARYHIGPLSRKDVAAYVSHRLAVAGAKGSLFETASLGELYRLSHGIPRLINVICNMALLGAYVQGQKMVNRRTLIRAAREVFGNGSMPRPRRSLKWLLTAVIMIISVTALAAGFYNRRVPLLPDTTSPAQKPSPSASEPAAEKLERLQWPDDQPVSSSEIMAYQSILKLWNVPIEIRERGASLCEQIRTWGLGCVNINGNFGSLLKLNRPAVFRISDGRNRRLYAALISVSGQTATVVIGGKTRRVGVEEISGNWQGGYTVVRRVTPKYSRIGPGDKGPKVQWLENQLALVKGNSTERLKSGTFDGTLRKQIEVFQLSEGLKADGIVGTQTLAHLNVALGRLEPALAGKGK